MLKKITILVLSLLLVQSGFSQIETATGKPDFSKIEKEIKDKNSPFFYTTLMKRYTDNDTTLTTEEYRYLYYGFSFQPKYSPYGKPAVQDELKKAIEARETDRIIELEKEAIAEYPFNLLNLYMLSKALEKKGEAAGADLYDKKMVAVARAILSTGDGTTDSTAMYVISVDHEYNMISLMGYEFGDGQSLIEGKHGAMDKMSIKKNDEGLEYLYFNVDRLFASMQKLFKKEK